MDHYPNSAGRSVARSGQGAITGPLEQEQGAPAQAWPPGAEEPPIAPPPPGYVPPEPRPQGTQYNQWQTQGGQSQQGAAPPPYQAHSSNPPGNASQPPYRTEGDIRREMRRARRPYSGGFLGPLLLIIAGIFLLLSNFGLLDANIWGRLWRLWPLVLVAVGLEILLGRRNPALSLLIVLLVIGGGLAFVYANGGFQARGNLATIPVVKAPLNGVESAVVNLELGVIEVNVDSSNSDPTVLATGTLQYYEDRGQPAQEFNSNARVGTLSLRQNQQGGGFPFLGSGQSPRWDLHVNPSVPLDLRVNTGAGKSDLKLNGLKLRSLNVNGGVGETAITFPSGAGLTTAKVNGGVGNLSLLIPEDVEARITVNKGLGNFSVDERFQQTGDIYQTSGYISATNKLDLSLDLGVGSVEVSTP
ncbi:MAG: hypothetical protein IVW55_18020 [Chloroflexi bacterium]|nr:hypothetical protein [Chloroflexota bacterium]